MLRVAIVGGGPGGLMTAYLLEKKLPGRLEIELFEASAEPGGKLRTRTFSTVPVPYESGAAECYDYSCAGRDPFRELLDELGLETRRMERQAVVMDGAILRDEADLERHAGASALAAVRGFRRRAADLLPRGEYVRWSWERDNAHPWAHRSCQSVLDEVAEPFARRYLQVVAHTDLATEPHLTSALNGLKNFVMDIPGYVECYTVRGGMSSLARALTGRLARTRLRSASPVQRIEGLADGTFHVTGGPRGRELERAFDAVFVALPPEHVGRIEFRGDALRRAVGAHVAHFDRPGHYLRVSMLFERPFWRPHLECSCFMLDAHGGICVYDESERYDVERYGVLGFLVAGSDALMLGNLEEPELVETILDSLPGDLPAAGRGALLETRVHRWAMGVSGQPGGLPLLDPDAAHRPDPGGHPGLTMVGGHLFDSTLNGVHRSAELGTDRLAARVARGERRRRASALARGVSPRTAPPRALVTR